MVLADVGDGFYQALLILHIALAILGFGGVLWNPMYGAYAKKRGGAGGLAISESTLAVNRYAEYCIYAVPIVGFALLGASGEAWKFSQTWVWLSLLLFIAGLGIAHAVLIPSSRRMIELQRELAAAGAPPAGAAGPPPQVAEMEAMGKKLQTFGPVNDVLLLVIIFLMVVKPGV